MENPILGGGYTCNVCGQYQRTSTLCNHFNLIDSGVKHNPNMKTKEELKSEYIVKHTKNWDEETKVEYMYELEEDFRIWYNGYTQCQEDGKDKKYTEEDMRRAMKYASEITNNKMKYMEDYINSLKKQD